MANTGDQVQMDVPIKGVGKYKNMSVNIGRVLGTNKPTAVSRGAFQGWSLPVFNSDDEELLVCSCIPKDWDGSSDFTFYVGGWLDTANTNKKFKLQLSYENWSPGDIVPTSMTDVEVETDTGTAAQYKTFIVEFPVSASGLTAFDALALRLRRIAASSDEIAGEFVVEGIIMKYVSDLIGEVL